MQSKRIPISARISQEDATFISELKLHGAKTPSDKLRLIIEEARERQILAQNYQGCSRIMQALVSPIEQKIRQAEVDNDVHSALLHRLSEWLPDTVAYWVSAGDVVDDTLTTAQLETMEKGLAERVFRLIESILQLGITQSCACYDSAVITQRISPVLELSNVIAHSQKNRGA